MKKRLIKKKVKQWSNGTLFEFVAYSENNRWGYFAEKEFYKRLEQEENSLKK